VSVNPGGGWADPLIGGRYHRDLGNGFGLTAYGDVGGFGVGAHTDWQVLGTVDYSLSPSWNLHLGYRSLNFNITGSEGRFGLQRPYERADYCRHVPFLTWGARSPSRPQTDNPAPANASVRTLCCNSKSASFLNQPERPGVRKWHNPEGASSTQ
jgi:hypothetical protein